MPNYKTEDIRNLTVAGHAGSGKTTLVEQMLHNLGVIGRVGRVEDGNTVCDYDDLEKEMGHSLDSALVNFDHNGAHFNIIDTPGSPDFIGKAIASLPGVEMAAIVIDAHAGIEPTTRRMMKVAREYGLPRMIIINKMDGGDDLGALVSAIQETFGSECTPVNLPCDGGKGVINCAKNHEGDSDLGDVAAYHTALIERIVETEESLMEAYFEQGDINLDQLRAAYGPAIVSGGVIPICFCSARENIGVTELMDFIAERCPSPVLARPHKFVHGTGDVQVDVVPEADASKPLIAHAFKVSSDPFVGKLIVFRVHQGTMSSDVQPLVDDAKKGLRIAHLFKVNGKDHTEVKEIIAGDIGAVAKIDDIAFNCTLHDGSVPSDIRMKRPPLPRPMFGLAIEGANKAAESKLGESIGKLIAEDPTLVLERVPATNQTVFRGLGQQHLAAKLRLLKDRYGVEVSTSTPRVAYKETITGKAEGHHRHKKQSGGSGQFGEVYLRVEPLNGNDEGATDGLLFVDDTFGGSIPKQFLPAIEKGVRQVMLDGAIAGYPMQDIKVSVYDGKYHAVDSKEVAFLKAGKRAFIDAVQKAKPVLLEPIVDMEITIPADRMGDVSSDLSGRRGRIQGTDMLPGNQAVVSAQAPLSEVQNYPAQLKSMTGGAGSFTMDYSHDERTPPDVQAKVVAAFKPQDDED